MHIIHINVYIYIYTHIHTYKALEETTPNSSGGGGESYFHISSVIFEYLQEECFNSYHFKVPKYIPITSHLLRGFPDSLAVRNLLAMQATLEMLA